MKEFAELKVFCRPAFDGTPEEHRTGLWGREDGSKHWHRICECPLRITYFPIDPTHLENFTEGHICALFNSIEVAVTVRNIVEVCRRNGSWTVKKGNNRHSFHLSDIRYKQGLPTLLDTGFVIKNDDETYSVTKGLVMLLVANELDRNSIKKTEELQQVGA